MIPTISRLFRFPAFSAALGVIPSGPGPAHSQTSTLEVLEYNDPTMIVDLGIGLWARPLPMDYNGDGLMDLVVAYSDKPSAGVYFFENSGRIDPQGKLPIFKPGVRIGDGGRWAQISYVRGQPVVTHQAEVFPNFRTSAFNEPKSLPVDPDIIPVPPGAPAYRPRQWRMVDYDDDGRTDIVVGVDYWGEYGWDDAWTPEGAWKNGSLRGTTYLIRNTGTDEEPVYEKPVRLTTTDGNPIEVYGKPSPSLGDFRGTGKLDLICGEFVDGFTFFENFGTREKPLYAPGRRLTIGGVPMKIDLCMFTVTPVDFDGDGHLDLIVGEEDGRLSIFQNTGEVVDGLPQFLPQRFFQQYARDVKFGALASPVSIDWDGDGLEDLVTGNSAGYIGFIKNLGGTPRRWAAPVYLAAKGKIIREQAGPNGSIQGPAEAKWGYSNIGVADWNGDGLPDILASGIWGKVVVYLNIGTRTEPRLAAAQPIEVAWENSPPHPEWNWWKPGARELSVQWRCTPHPIDLNGDGLMDLVMVDHEGYLAFFERRRTENGNLELLPGRRVFWAESVSSYNRRGEPTNETAGLLRLNEERAGRSGRRTFCFFDWDGDGVIDLLVNSQNVTFLKGKGLNSTGQWVFEHRGLVHPTAVLAGHSTTPTTIRRDGRNDLLIGAEDGRFHLLPNPYSHRR